jgi:hypothetical protein
MTARVELAFLHEWVQERPDGRSLVEVHGVTYALEQLSKLPLMYASYTLTGYDDQAVNRYAFQFDARIATVESLPRLFRGATAENANGMSWTDDASIAGGYAEDRGGDIYEADFTPDDVLAIVRVDMKRLGDLVPGEQDDPTPYTEWIMRPNGTARLVPVVGITEQEMAAMKARDTRQEITA